MIAATRRLQGGEALASTEPEYFSLARGWTARGHGTVVLNQPMRWGAAKAIIVVDAVLQKSTIQFSKLREPHTKLEFRL